jgi:F0F1-type ATP synthase assembly protein I
VTTDEGAGSRPRDSHGTDTILTIAIEVVVAVAVWGLVGLVLDLVAGTGPWLQYIGILLGTMVGLALVQRRATPAEVDDA